VTHRPARFASLGSLPYLPVMKVIQDCFGTSVRLTDERLEHILDHPELVGMANELERVLQTPMEVRRSRSDDDVKLFYEFYAQAQVGGKLLCVVVKYLPDDAFVITAYLTDRMKAGEILWPKS
jgi:hypothetical protein